MFQPSFSPIFFTLLFHPSFFHLHCSAAPAGDVTKLSTVGLPISGEGSVGAWLEHAASPVSTYCNVLHHIAPCLIPLLSIPPLFIYFCSVSFVILSFASPRWNDVIFLNWCSCCRRLKKDWACNKARGRHRTEGLRYNWAVN